MIEIIVQRILSSQWLRKFVVGVVALLTSVRYGAGLYFWRVTEQLERPSYEILRTLPNKVELRRYDSYLIAETSITTNTNDEKQQMKDTTGQGFRACAGYIFGKNISPSSSTSTSTKGEKMAMTAPVRSTSNKVSFVIGSQYTIKTVPQPTDSNVTLRRVPPHTLAVRAFSGPPPKDARIQKERLVLERTLEKEHIQLKTNNNDDDATTTLVYGYHDPFLTPNFLRRNEVAVVIDGSV